MWFVLYWILELLLPVLCNMIDIVLNICFTIMIHCWINCCVVCVSLLKILETCVKNGNKAFHLQVAQKDFLQELLRLATPRNNPPHFVLDKVLGLIQVLATLLCYVNFSTIYSCSKLYRSLGWVFGNIYRTDQLNAALQMTWYRLKPLQCIE